MMAGCENVNIGGKEGAWINAGMKALSAETITEDSQDELGRSVAIAATNRWPLYDKPELNKYVTMVGLAVASATDRPDGNWVFGVLDTPDLGAYSGPNGYIMVTRGALLAMEDEAELAGVLAHEIAHVLNRDGLEAVKNAKRAQAVGEAAAASSERTALFNQMSGELASKVLTSGWSQGQESKADSKAVELLIGSGYDPAGLTRFLQRLQAKQGSGGKLFSTHPGTGDRIAKTTSQIGGRTGGATNKERFAKAVAAAK
jgi:predicted Zn-dependent protease